MAEPASRRIKNVRHHRRNCYCPDCKQGRNVTENIAQARRNRDSQEHATNSGQPWDTAALAVLADASLGSREAARQLGRSTSAVQHRRSLLGVKIGRKRHG